MSRPDSRAGRDESVSKPAQTPGPTARRIVIEGGGPASPPWVGTRGSVEAIGAGRVETRRLLLPVGRRRAGAERSPAAFPRTVAGASMLGAPRGMTLRGYTSPRSPEGRSSLVPYPPWHYVGDFLVIEYWADPAARPPPCSRRARPASRPRAAARRSLRTGSRARPTGTSSLDPSRSQYKEFFIVVNALLRRRGGDDLPLHLGRSRLRARPRLAPGVPEEARLDLDHAPPRPRVRRRPGPRARARPTGEPAPRTSAGSPRAP